MTEGVDRAADTAARQARALQLRKAGVTFDQIAREVGYANRGSAHRAVAAALRASRRESPTESHELDGQRLDQILVALWPQAMRGDGAAVDRILRMMELRASPAPAEHRGTVAAATSRDLVKLPEDLRLSAAAAAALELARNVDNGVSPAVCARELRTTLAQLAEAAARAASVGTSGEAAGLGDLFDELAKRRSASSS